MINKNVKKSILTFSVAAGIILATPILANAAWKQDGNGWWYTEGNSYAIGWRQIDGSWYYFDKTGYMKTGWLQEGSEWYYLDSTGKMKTGWLEYGNKWYYFDASGKMQTKWVQVNSKWYYFDKDGIMQIGWLNDGGKWYYLKKESNPADGSQKGEMLSNAWQKDNNKWYYFKQGGEMAANEWIMNFNNTYYVDSSGAMLIGWQDIDNERYYFNPKGELILGLYTIDKVEYYFDIETGKLLRNVNYGTIVTDEEGRVIKFDEKEAEKHILANDSNYLEKKKQEYNEIILVSGEYTTIADALDNGYNVYIIENEECYQFKLIGKNDTEEVIGSYLVGVDTKNIYSLNNIEGSIIYEIKDNTIENKYTDIVEEDSLEWRE